MLRPAAVVLLIACVFPIAACSSESSTSSPGDAGAGYDAASQDAASQDATSQDAAIDATNDAPADSAADAHADSGGACLADGKYGKCTENPGCYCLKGAKVYQFCTTTCQSAADCGDAASLPGAKPGCYPMNPGASQMICALVCNSNSDCPCGLVCTASGVGTTKICAEMQ